MSQSKIRITQEENYEASAVLYSLGDQADHTFLLKSGKVELLDKEGNSVKTVKAGQVFGESALVSSEARRAHTAKVLEDCHCLKIARQPLEEQLKLEDPFIAALFRILQGNMANVMQMKKLTNEDVKALSETMEDSSRDKGESV